jgi:hypothetical protein
MAVSLARLRAEADLVVAPSSECWLRSRRPVPAALHGPGIHIVRDRLGWSELLAVADAVLAEPGKMALDALALGKPLTLLAPEPPRSGRVDLARHWPTLGLWTEIPCLFTPSDPLPNTAVAPDEALELQDSLAPELGRWVGRLDGAAAQRAAEAIREEAERRAMERTLAELQQRAAPL